MKKIDHPVRVIYFRLIKKIDDQGYLILMQLLRLNNFDVIMKLIDIKKNHCKNLYVHVYSNLV